MRVVPGGLAAFNGLAYGVLEQSTVDFFQNQLAMPTNIVGPYRELFVESQKSIYDNFISQDALERARLAMLYSNRVDDGNTIRRFTLLEEFQAAQSEMQRWLMAMPELAKLHNQQLCDGFSSTFKHEGLIPVGEKNYDYRRVMDGIAHVNEQGDEVIVEYFEDLRVASDNLHIVEQSRLQTTFEIGRMLLKKGKDISNPEGGNL